jgi:hypothetical protein
MKFIELLTIELNVLETIRKNHVLNALIESNNSPWFNERSIYLMTDHELSRIPVFPYDRHKYEEFFMIVVTIANRIKEVTEYILQEKSNGTDRSIQEPVAIHESKSCSDCIVCTMRTISSGVTNPKKAIQEMEKWSPKTLQFAIEYHIMKYETSVPSLKQLSAEWLNSSKLQIC